MYVPRFAAVGVLGAFALFVMPFFLFRLLVFLLLIKLIARVIVGRRCHHRYRHAHHHPFDEENRAEPLEAGDYRFFARRFEKEYEEEPAPRYSEKDLV